jgi:hypothetical protein
MMIGAPGEDEGGVDAGAVYFYRKVNGNWQLIDRIASGNMWAGYRAGEVIDLNGNTAVAGYPTAFNYGNVNNGMIAVWRRQANGHWVIQNYFTFGAEADDNLRMGSEVAVGPHCIAFSYRGANDDGWVESLWVSNPDDVTLQYLDEPNSWRYHVPDYHADESIHERYGTSIAVTENDDIVIGATAGRTRAYVFENGHYQPSRRIGAAGGSSMGTSVAMMGTTLLVSEPQYLNNGLNGAGGVRSFNEVDPLNGADLCEDAMAIGPGTYTGCTATASADVRYICTNAPNAQFSPDVYYMIEADSTGFVTLDTAGSNFDTVLAVYDGCEGAMLECNDDALGLGYQSRVTMLLNKGQTYSVRIAGYNGATGQFDLTYDQQCGTSDFNWDGDFGTDQDIEAFFACLAGNCCATCGSADFNGDGDTGTDADIEAFFSVLAGGPC